MRHESKSVVPCVWRSRRLRVLTDGILRGLCPFFLLCQAERLVCPQLPEPGGQPQRPPLPGIVNRAHRPDAGVSGDRGASMPVLGLVSSYLSGLAASEEAVRLESPPWLQPGW